MREKRVEVGAHTDYELDEEEDDIDNEEGYDTVRAIHGGCMRGGKSWPRCEAYEKVKMTFEFEE